MMERLTKYKFGNVVSEKQAKTGIHCSNFCNNCSRGTGDCKHLKAMVEKLAAYEDAEEQGLLMKLPCKVGDTVYVKMASHCDIQYAEAEVRDFAHFTSCGFCAVVTSKHFDKQNIPFADFGKTAFLTQDEAEEKLKGIKQ